MRATSCGTNSPLYGCFHPTWMLAIGADSTSLESSLHWRQILSVRVRRHVGRNDLLYRCFRPTRMIGVLADAWTAQRSLDVDSFRISPAGCGINTGRCNLRIWLPGGGHLSLVWRGHNGIGN
jgi:hypothetical protein